MEELIVAKIVSIAVLGIFAFICGVIPIKLKKYFEELAAGNERKQKVFDITITVISCFGAGVILTTCFAHMIPDANEEMEMSIKKGYMSATGFPLVEILALVGFFVIYLVEELTQYFMAKWYPQQNNKNTNSVGMAEANVSNGGHGHSHGFEIISGSVGSFKAMLRCFIVIIALGLHSIFEGIAIGLGHEPQDVWYLFFAIASHKFVVAFVIGMQFVVAGLSKCMVVTLILIFSSISPIGIAIGLGLTIQEAGDNGSTGAATTVLNALAAGTLLYVVFFEVLEKERGKNKYGIIQVFCIILGFLFMLIVNVIEIVTGVEEEDEDPLSQCSVTLADIQDRVQKGLSLKFTCENNVLTYLEE